MMTIPPRCKFCTNLKKPGRFKLYRPCKTDTENDGMRCQACLELEQVEAQIAEAVKVVDRLFERHREIRMKMNQAHDPMNHKIPPEITSYIFQLSMPPLPADNNLRKMTPAALAAPVVLSAVCKVWRQIALSTPQLWDFVKITITNKTDLRNRCDFIRERLNRSGELPITVCLNTGWEIKRNIPILQDLAKTVIQCSDRWHVLDLHCDSDFIPFITGHSASLLRILRLRVMKKSPTDKYSFKITNARPEGVDLEGFSHRDELLKSIDINWSRVTCVRLSCVCLDECLQLLRLAPQLERCTFAIERDDTIEGSTVHAPESTVIHNVIQELVLENVTQSRIMTAAKLLVSICFPALRSLTYGGYKELAPSILRFLKHSSCSLRELTIAEVDSDNVREFIHLLREIPSLCRVEYLPTLKYDEANDILNLLATTTIAPRDFKPRVTFVPELESVKLAVSSIRWIRWGRLAKIIGPLNDPQNPGRRPLHTVKIHFDVNNDPHPEQYIDKDTLRHLQQAWQAGFNLQIGDPSREYDLIQATVDPDSMRHVTAEWDRSRFHSLG